MRYRDGLPPSDHDFGVGAYESSPDLRGAEGGGREKREKEGKGGREREEYDGHSGGLLWQL
jgi:hypothetical protein